MQVLDSLQQLGYSSINIVLVFLVIMLIVQRTFKKYLSSRFARSLFVAIGAVAFVFTINYLAEVNMAAIDSYNAKRASEQSAGN